jgi:phosphate-selective porin OprO/OprP
VIQDAGVLLVQTADQSFKWWLDGRLMLDAAAYAGGSNKLSNGAEVRRARLGFRMVFWKVWASKFEVDFADNEVAVKDMWLAYTGWSSSTVKIGHYSEPFCLDMIMSSRYIPFIERASVSSFVPDRRLGVSYSRWGEHWQLTGGLFGQSIGNVDLTGDDQGFSVTGRFTFTPIRRPRTLIHLGVAGSRRTPDAPSILLGKKQVRITALPETHVSRGHFLDTGRLTDVDHTSLLGLEAASVFGPVSFQGEYVLTRISRENGRPSPTFSGWYAFVSWFPTGDVRPYDPKGAEFVRLIPKHRRGAVELVARYSTMDLNDFRTDVRGGREDVLTLGVNWYANPNVRLMVDYLRVFNDAFTTGDRHYAPGVDFNVIQARLQLLF